MNVKHLRRDYDHIQDPTGKIGADEPIFLLRAKDATAPQIVQAWADLQPDLNLHHAVSAWATHMARWQAEHPGLVKYPDAPLDALRYDPSTNTITA